MTPTNTPIPAVAREEKTPQCLICGAPVPDYVPKYCCDGRDCGCMGQPVYPCTCSRECDNALFAGIGKPMDQRRIDAGIKRHQ